MKKISSFKLILVLLVIEVAWSCSREQYHYKGIPEVQTTSVKVLDDTGAHFTGAILATGEEAVIQHGFTWSTSEYVSFEETFHVLLGPTDKNGKFEFIAQSDILAGEKYYLRAFIRTSAHLVYGETLIFTGAGSLGPNISSISPASGMAGDTVVIKGSFFSSVSRNNKVLFDAEVLNAIWSDECEMRFVVPFTSYGKKTIGVQVSGITSSTNAIYEVVRENPTVFTPVSASFGDTITLYGDRLCPLREHVSVFFNGVSAEITGINRNYYRVIVPAGNTRSPVSISIKSWGTVSYSEQFTLEQVQIESAVPLVLHPADTLTFTGAGFNPDASLNRITVGGEVAIPVTSTGSSLRILVPWLLEPGTYDVTITTIDDQPVTLYNLIEIRTQWKRLPDFPGVGRSDIASFVLGDKAYAGTGSNGEELLGDMWEYDGTTGSWNARSNFPRPTTEVVGLSLPGIGYMADFEIFDYPKCPIYSHDPVSDTWETMTPLPTFYYDGKGAGFEIAGSLYLLKNTFTYRYTRASDSWSLIADIYSYYFQRGVAFSDGSFGYFGIGKEKGTTNTTMWYRYNPTENKWEARATFPGVARNSAVAFFLPNGKGYVGLGYSSSGQYLKDFWEYDPVNDRWKRLSDFPGAGRSSAGAFAIGDQGFVLTGNNGTELNDFWVFDPSALDF